MCAGATRPYGDGLRLGLPHQRRRAAGALHRRLEGRRGIPAAGDVLSRTAVARCAASAKPGEIVWSRIYVEDESLHMDIGRGGVVALPREETERRWQATTPQWPIMHAVTYGVSRDQMMAKHQANHIQVAYATVRRRRRRVPVHQGRDRARARDPRQRLRRPSARSRLALTTCPRRPDNASSARPVAYAWVDRGAALSRRAAELPRSADAGDDEDVDGRRHRRHRVGCAVGLRAGVLQVGLRRSQSGRRLHRGSLQPAARHRVQPVRLVGRHVVDRPRATYEELVAARALMGVSEAFYIPAALALVADYHRGPTRSRAVGLHQTGIYCGLILGGFAGLRGGCAGVRLALGLHDGRRGRHRVRAAAVLAAPQSGAGGGSAAPSLSPMAAARELAGNRNYLLLVLYFTLPAIAGWVIRDWMPVILKDQFQLTQGRAGRHRRALRADARRSWARSSAARWRIAGAVAPHAAASTSAPWA